MRAIKPREQSTTTHHPTRVALVAVCHQLLDEQPPEGIVVQDVLRLAGVTKGALYHHFSDFSELIEVTLVERFARYVDDSVTALAGLADSCHSRHDLLAALAVMTRETQRSERGDIRLSRAHVLTMAATNPRMGAALAAEQQRLTEALTELVAEAQRRGWFNSEFDPVAGAVFIQAYTLGRIVDDVSAAHVDQDAWIRLVDRVIERAFA